MQIYRGSVLLGRLLVVAIHGFLLQSLLFLSLLLQKSLLLGSLLLPCLLRGQLDLLPLLPVLLQLHRIAFLFDQLLLQMPEHLDDLSLGALLDPFLGQFSHLILVVALDVFDDHIVEIVAEDLPDFVAAVRLLPVLLLAHRLDVQLVIVDEDLLALADVDFALALDELYALVGEFQLRGDFAVEGEEFGLQYFLGGLGVVLHFPVPGVYVPDGAYRLWLLHQLSNYTLD